MKKCNICNESKEYSEFYKDKRAKDLCQTRCIVCHKAYFKARNLANPQANRDRAKAWREDNPEKYATYLVKWKKANKDKVNETNRKSYKKKKSQ